MLLVSPPEYQHHRPRLQTFSRQPWSPWSVRRSNRQRYQSRRRRRWTCCPHSKLKWLISRLCMPLIPLLQMSLRAGWPLHAGLGQSTQLSQALRTVGWPKTKPVNLRDPAPTCMNSRTLAMPHQKSRINWLHLDIMPGRRSSQRWRSKKIRQQVLKVCRLKSPKIAQNHQCRLPSLKTKL